MSATNAMQSPIETGSAPPVGEPAAGQRNEPLRPEGKRFIARELVAAVIELGLALAAARSLRWANAWLLAAVVLGLKVASALVLMRFNQAVLNARGTKRDMSPREKRFFSVFVPSSLAIPVVAGLEAGVAGWSHHSNLELTSGVAMLVAGMSVLLWALAVNPFFEKTVRMQHDRSHRVCTSGPYRYVRHPGYVAAVMSAAALPLMLGSYWAFVPVALLAVAFVVRTAYEDRMLRAELAGYEAYARATRYRLIPFIW